jgi:hypothetical protein
MATTTRRAPRDTDSPAVDFNFDTWESEQPTKPFAVVVGGKRYVLQSPEKSDYRDLLEAQRAQVAGDPTRAIELVLPEESRAEFFANRLPSDALGAMFAKYNSHFGLPNPGEAPASSRS